MGITSRGRTGKSGFTAPTQQMLIDQGVSKAVEGGIAVRAIGLVGVTDRIATQRATIWWDGCYSKEI